MGDKDEVLEAVVKEAVDLVPLICCYMGFFFSFYVCPVFYCVLGYFCFGFLLSFLNFQENVPLEEVFQTLRCNKNGLTTEAAHERLAIFGHNKLEEKKVFSPLSSLLSIVLCEARKKKM